jgi:eukaryotic-like serine/threonine-protein kinase
MPLTPGSRLGPYEILSAIGAGGMGEVYRAKDPRLGREVAIKVLPASFSADADRLRRFEQEAKAAGALNHPNVTAVYDIGSHDGAPYVVQELLEGETLRSVLARGRVSPRRAIDYSLQIVHGLAAAHEKGIVHRDLKPDNIFVTSGGRVKILDFGLAKLTHTEERGQITSLPTASAGTEPGVVLGTLGYMSPEQVRGRPADQRSDIFSFGAILYEMLSGRRAFQGDSAADTMSAILKEDPPDLSVTNQSVPPALERIVRHCLEKSPEQRFHSAHDLGFDLEAVSSASGAAPSGARGAGSRRRPLRAAALVLAALGLLAGVFWTGRRSTRADRDSPASEMIRNRITFRRGNLLVARFTADAKTVVYAASWGGQPTEIYLTRFGSPETRPLGFPGASLLAVSSGGELAILLKKGYLFGAAGSGTLARVPLAGGAPRHVAEDVLAADWLPDGEGLAVIRQVGGKNVVEFPLGKAVYSTPNTLSDLRMAPDGTRVALVEADQSREWIDIIDRAGHRKELVKGFIYVDTIAWHPSGQEVWLDGVSERARLGIHAAGVDGQTRLIVPALDQQVIHDIARDGSILVEREISTREVAGAFPGDREERALTWLGQSHLAALSSDGKTLLFWESGEAGGPVGSVYLRSTDGTPAARLGGGQGNALSMDGKWALILVPSTSGNGLVLLPTGAGAPRPIVTRGLSIFGGAFLPPDDKRLLIAAAEPGQGMRGYVMDLPDGKPRAFTTELINGGALSPDGNYAAFTGADRRPVIYPIAGGAPRPIAGLEPDDVPIQWSADGGHIFAAHYGLAPLPVYRVDLKTGKRETWKQLAPADRTGFIRIDNVIVTRDGASYVYSFTRVGASDLFLVQGLK